MYTDSSTDVLRRKFYLTELFANLVGAPLATIYGGSLIDFSVVPLRRFLVGLAVVIVANQLVLALPMNLRIGSLIRSRLGNANALTPRQQYAFLSRLPLLQAGLILLRMSLCVISAVLVVAAWYDDPLHVAATITYGLYAAFATGMFIYFYLHTVSTPLLEKLVADNRGDPDRAIVTRQGKTQRVIQNIVAVIPLMIPSLVTSVGIIFLILSIRNNYQAMDFFTSRIMIALLLNLVTIPAILMYNRHYGKKRLFAIQDTLRQMIDHGRTGSLIATDLRDDTSRMAALINDTLDIFRLMLEKLKITTDSLSSTVMKYSSQNRETVAATTQQAAAVKEIVATMQDSGNINQQIQEQAVTLTDNAEGSQEQVDNGFGKVQDTIQKMTEIREANQNTLQEIAELSEEISSIDEIIDLINGIANQTRIIAFNAELEASSAGSAGASFRIVAEEIRRLANSTVDSLSSIKGRIQQIKTCSQRLQNSSEEGTQKIGEGMNLSHDLNSIFMQIRSSSENTSSSARDITSILVGQNQAFEQIFSTLKQISEGAEQILSGTRDGSSETTKVQGLIDELKELLVRFSASPADSLTSAPTLEGSRQ